MKGVHPTGMQEARTHSSFSADPKSLQREEEVYPLNRHDRANLNQGVAAIFQMAATEEDATYRLLQQLIRVACMAKRKMKPVDLREVTHTDLSLQQ